MDSQPEARSSREALLALQQIYTETEKLYHQSNAFIARVYGHEGISMGRRSVLLVLFFGGSQTVPQLAQAQSVSRQYIQKLVNQLAGEGYITFVENAAHKRSHLVQLTTEGRTYMEAMLRREMKIVSAQVIDFPVEALAETARMLQAIREWQKRELERLLPERQV